VRRLVAKKRDSAQSKPRATTGGANVRKRAVDPSTHGEAEFFRALTENALDGILVLNSDGTVRYESPFAERTLGRKHGDRVGKSMFERIHPEDAPKVTEAFARLVQKPGSTAVVQLRLQHGDGSWRLVEGTARSLLDDPAVNGVVVNFHDITERKRMEEALHEQQQYFESLIENSQAGMSVLSQDGTVRYESPFLERMLGREPGEQVGKSALESVHPDDLPAAASVLAEMSQHPGATAELELRLQHKDGSWRFAQGNGRNLLNDPAVQAIVVSIHDVTERKQMEEALRSGERYFRTLMENSLDSITILNADGTLRWESPSASRMLGYEEGQGVGKTSFELVHPDDMPKVTDTLARLLQNPGGTEHLDVRIQHKDGSWRTLEVTAKNLVDDSIVAGIVVNQHDVTERKEAEEALRESEEKFRSLAEHSPNMVFIYKNGRVVYANRECERLMGYTRKEFYSPDFDFATIIAPECAHVVKTALRSHMKGKEVSPYEYTLITKGGERIEAILTTALMRYEGETAILGAVTDITERKQAEEALQKSEEYYRSLLENAMEAIAVVSRDGLIAYESPSYKRVLGRDPEDAIGATAFDFIHPDDLPGVSETFAQLLDNPGGTVQAEVRSLHNDGSYRNLEIVGRNLIGDQIVDGIVANFRDITERKQAEEALRESEEYFRALTENSLEGVTVVNTDGSLRYISPALKRMLGYEPEEQTGGNLFELIHEDDVQRVAGVFSDLLQNRIAEAHTVQRVRHKDGTWRYIEAISNNLLGNPAVSGIVGNFRDITERVKAEDELRKSEEKLRLMFDSVSDSVAVTDLEGTITEVNDRGVEMHGFGSKDEMLGISAFELIAPSDRERAVINTGRVLEQGSVVSIEYTLVRADGSEFPGELSASQLQDANGNPIGFVAVVRDITDRKKVEQETRGMEEQRHLTARLATVGQLAAGVAHELNNPLAAVQGFAQLLTERKDLEESIRSDVECIFNEAKRATKITANLLSFARKHQPEKRLVSINEVIDRSLELHAYRMKVNNIDVQTELAADLPATMADFHQIQQVFVNIISNAEQAMTEAHGKGTLSVLSEWSGDTIKVALADDGPGIPQGDLDRIFEPFYTTKEVGKGTGLGLDICRGIVERHGGRMYAASVAGEGTTFVIEIPVVSEGQALAEQEDSASVT
jgi:PAS domain S-box-containing protein